MKTDVRYPRTLIVGAYFSEETGSGTYLGRLFSNWPIDCVATVCGDTSSLDWNHCTRHYRVGDQEFKLQAPFKWFYPSRVSGQILPSTSDSTPKNLVLSSMSVSRRMAKDIWHMLLRILGGGDSAGDILYQVRPSPKLILWAHDFNPEVIYGHFSSLNSLIFLFRMQQALAIPLVLHFMDDFPEALYRSGFASRYLRRNYLREFERLVHSAGVAIGICQEMAEEYQKRYCRKIISLPMPVEMKAYETLVRAQRVANQPFRLRDGGRVGWAIHDSIMDIALAVHKLRQVNVDVTFDIVTFQKDKVPINCLNLDGVTVQQPGPLTDLPRFQLEADLLVICYDFDAESFRQARYSMPSKMADCMASGTPILVYGPAGLPVVEYARREKWGKVVDSRDSEVLESAICEIMTSALLRDQYGKKANRLAGEIHDAEIVSNSLKTILQNVIDQA